ncbi:MAG TPA: hypothetical protein P5116_04590 [Eubacteriales bacterium]|nr:hypothetical protein [Eubacteriales bacterium]
MKLCNAAGLLSHESVVIDGSKFRAVNADNKSYVSSNATKVLLDVEEKISQYMKELDEIDTAESKAGALTKEDITGVLDYDGRLDIVGLCKGIIDFEAAFPAVLADGQVPCKGRSVAVPVIEKSGIHTHDRVREQTCDDCCLAHIFAIDPLIVSVANFFNHTALYESLDVIIKQARLMQFAGTHHTVMRIKYLLDFIIGKHPIPPLLLFQKNAFERIKL